MKGKVIAFPSKQHEWEVRFKTPIRMRVGTLPFMIAFGPDITTAKVQADSLRQAKFIVQQHLPVDEWLD